MNVQSINFNNMEVMPKIHTCQGEGISPQISWENFPLETKSFALIMEDPDALGGTFLHWLVVNIPRHTTFIKEKGTNIAIEHIIQNDGGNENYFPPCPPSGSHRYIFSVFALNVDKIDDLTKETFKVKIKQYIIDSASMTATYQKK